jgi:hypothetical protein
VHKNSCAANSNTQRRFESGPRNLTSDHSAGFGIMKPLSQPLPKKVFLGRGEHPDQNLPQLPAPANSLSVFRRN